MKACINTLLPIIVRIVNLSLNEACVPEIFKQSAVEPRLMKPMFDNELLSSYRPISNLRFISKAIEKVAADRLNCNLINNDPHELLQSSHKPGHSTETALHPSYLENRSQVVRVDSESSTCSYVPHYGVPKDPYLVLSYINYIHRTTE